MFKRYFLANCVCYHGTWAEYRNGNGKFGVSKIDSQCTHLIYSFIGLKANGTVYSLDTWLDYDLSKHLISITIIIILLLLYYIFFLDTLNAFAALKNAREGRKVLVAVGGWSHSSTFPAVAASASARAVFLQSALEFLEKHGFDGLDFDWEYPNKRGGTQVDVVSILLYYFGYTHIFFISSILYLF